MLPTKDLINKLEGKGITFTLITKEDAEHFLEEHNYYLKVTSYRFNYSKDQYGKYKGLDFFHLRELSTIDMYLRFILLKFCLNLEHSLKVKLLRDIENNGFDDYDIVSQFTKEYDRVLTSVSERRNTSYCLDLINKHDPHYPIYVMLEIISFGNLVTFCEWYQKKNQRKLVNVGLLYNVRDLRNACAHSNCLLHDLRASKNSRHKVNQQLTTDVIRRVTLSERSIKKKLSNRTLKDISSLLILFEEMVDSDEIKEHRVRELSDFMRDRMIEKKDHFRKNDLLCSSYRYVLELLDTIRV